MKIIHIIDSLYTGGAEKLLVDTIPLYIEKGIKVDLLLLNGNKTPFYEKLEKQNINIYYLSKGDIKSVYNPLLIFKIIPYLKKYDLIHVHLFPAQYWAVIAKILSFSKVKLIFTEHNTSNRRLENKLFYPIEKIIYKFYTKIVTITNEVKNELVTKLKINNHKIVIINNGVNLKQINIATSYNKEYFNYTKDSVLILMIAGFRDQKDQDTLIKSMVLLPENYKLLLAGDGIRKHECIKLVDKLNLQNRVQFLGIRNDIPQLLKSVDISVLSSHWEGFGLVAVEGMAAGKPFIASDVPGLREVVKDAGILFEKGNEEELAEQILKLMKNKEYYNSIAQKCSERSKQYDIHKMVDEHINLYNQFN